MKTLTITDLARTEQLDSSAMAAVRGGTNMRSPFPSFGNFTYAPHTDTSINAAQSLGQVQEIMTSTANGSAFLQDVDVNTHASQQGENKIVRHG